MMYTIQVALFQMMKNKHDVRLVFLGGFCKLSGYACYALSYGGYGLY